MIIAIIYIRYFYIQGLEPQKQNPLLYKKMLIFLYPYQINVIHLICKQMYKKDKKNCGQNWLNLIRAHVRKIQFIFIFILDFYAKRFLACFAISALKHIVSY